jgi:hypothetical protein
VTPVNALHRVKGELRDAGLTPQDLVACFISRRVSPLQRRSHKICQMSGPKDPTRHSTHDLTPADILRWIKDICKCSQATFAWGLEPYSRDRPAPMVNPPGRYIISYPAYRYLSRHISIYRHISCLARDIAICRHISCLARDIAICRHIPLFDQLTLLLCRNSASRPWRTPALS